MVDQIPMKHVHVLPRELLREIALNLPAIQCAELYSLPISSVFDSYVSCLHRSYIQKKVRIKSSNLLLKLQKTIRIRKMLLLLSFW